MKKILTVLALLCVASLSFAQRAGEKVTFSSKDMNGAEVASDIFTKNKITTHSGFKSGSNIVMNDAVSARTFLIPIVYRIDGIPMETIPVSKIKKQDFAPGTPERITNGRHTHAVIR